MPVDAKAPNRGSVVLLKTSGAAADAALVTYLATLLPKISPDRIAARIAGERPLTLLRKVPEAAAARIVHQLRELGAEASFRVDALAPPEPDAPPPRPPGSGPRAPVSTAGARPPLASRKAPRAARPDPSPGIARRAADTPGPFPRSKALTLGLPAGLLALLLVALAAGSVLGDRLPLPRPVQRLCVLIDDTRTLRSANTPDFSALSAFSPPLPSAMEVPPREMLATYRAQQRERPDRRFPMALEVAARRYEQLAGIPGGTYRVGTPAWSERAIRVPLLRGTARIAEVALPLPASFAQGLETLGTWVTALVRDGGARQSARAPAAAARAKATVLVAQIDPRTILQGLQELDALASAGDRDPRLLLAAARGYAQLTFVLVPDGLEEADPLAAEALAFLALTRHFAPTLPAQREEALLAAAMGYAGHAASLLERPGGPPDPGDAAVDAYLRRDVQKLAALRDAAPADARDSLPHYLLARLYGDLRLGPEAQAAALDLLKRSSSYPAVIEGIVSADLGLARRLTLLYPLDILGRLEARTDPLALLEPAAFEKRLAAFAGEQQADEITLARFERLLASWNPFGAGQTPRFLLDAERVRRTYRVLYTDAVAARFRLLQHRLNVIEAAEKFAASVAVEHEGHPLALALQADVAAARGQQDRVNELARRILESPAACGGRLAYMAIEWSDPLAGRLLFPRAAARLDGRPYNRYLLGSLEHYRLSDLEAAARAYRTALAADPYLASAAKHLALALGTPEPLEQALAAAPASFQLAEQAGDYYASRGDAASLGKAAAAYREALRTAPSRSRLSTSLADVLTRLQRHPEALAVYDAWLQRYGNAGLETIIMKAGKAEVYLAMRQPRQALETIRGEVGSFQADAMLAAARAYEQSGAALEAAKLFRAVRERYPASTGTALDAAGFMWRQRDDKQAAQLLATVRAQHPDAPDWYAPTFVRALAGAPRERILAALDALREGGATPMELLAVAYRLFYSGQPRVAATAAMATTSPQPMQNLEIVAAAYGFLSRCAGPRAAADYYRGAVPRERRGPALMVMFSSGEYEGLLAEVGDPASYDPQYREFIWLQSLIASLALDGGPPEWKERLRAHYARAGSPDFSYAIGSFLQGGLTQEQLLDRVASAQQRCEVAYYLGLAARLRGEFQTAAAWYQLALQTGLSNNGEFHWALEELLHWQRTGMRGRDRLPRDDLRQARAQVQPQG